MGRAEEGIAKLFRYADCLVVLPSQHIYQVASKRGTFKEMHMRSDETMAAAVGCIRSCLRGRG